MTDYAGNSKNQKSEPTEERPKQEKIVTGEVEVKPRSFGRKARDVFFGGEFRTAISYIFGDVLIPAARDMMVDATTKGIQRMVYGNVQPPTMPGLPGQPYQHHGPRIQYNMPVQRNNIPIGVHLPDQPPRPYRQNRMEVNDIILGSREEAERVVATLMEIASQYGRATLSDLYEMLGLPTDHTNNKWGWEYLGSAGVNQVHGGYQLDLPMMQSF